MVGKDIPAQVFHSIQVKVLATFLLILLPVYVLGAVIFHWTYLQMHQQIIRSQMALLNLYAETIDDEISRIRLLEYNCINDDDLVYLANAYPILDTFERSQYLLRAQHRLQVMKNSSMCIGNVVLHLPTVGKSIDTRNVEPLAESWNRQPEALPCAPSSGLTPTKSGELQMSIQYPLTPREGSTPPLVMWLTLSNAQIQRLLQGMDHTQETGLVLTSPDSCFVLEKTDNASFLNPELLTVSQQLPSTEEVTVEGKHFQKTVVALEESDLVLISFSSTEHLFGFRHTYLFLLVLFGVVSVLAMCLFAFSVRHLVHKPIRTLVDAFRCMKGNNFDVRIHQKRNDEFAYLYQSFNGMMDHLQKLIEQIYDQRLLTQRAELKQLQSQINPHFLYNGFYNIYRMAKKDSNDDIAEFSQLLSEYYQYITRNAADTVTMEQEIRHAMTYLKIQQIRFSNRLSVEIGPTPSEFGFLMVPRLILQPILENAFEHGMKNVLEPKLFIRFEARLGEWNVCIEDNGTEFSPEELSELQQKLDSTDTQMETTALINIHRRLRYHFGPESGLRLSRTPAGSLQVQLHIVKEE